MKQTKFIIAGLLCALSLGVMAKDSDILQEVKIKAVRQSADIKNNQVIYYGPVEVTQGSIRILADELRAFSVKASGESIIVATGNPATYSQVMEDGRIASASAKEIRYELAKRTMTLSGDATLDQAGSNVSANRIRYDIAQQKLIAESSGEDRVITIIKPQNYQETKQQESGPETSAESQQENASEAIDHKPETK